MPQLIFAGAMAGVSANSSVEAGKQAEINAKISAIQDERDADAEQVSAQTVAAQERRKMRILRSRALAVAGASGGGVDDKTVQDIIVGIEAEGEQNALNALYSGDIEARALRMNARAERSRGGAVRSAYNSQALATGAQFASKAFSSGEVPTFFSKYGDSAAQSTGLGTGYSDFAGQPHGDEWMA